MASGRVPPFRHPSRVSSVTPEGCLRQTLVDVPSGDADDEAPFIDGDIWRFFMSAALL